MRFPLLPSAVFSAFFFSLTAVAGAAPGEVPTALQQVSPVPEGCPVSLDVRRSDQAQRLTPAFHGSEGRSWSLRCRTPASRT